MSRLRAFVIPNPVASFANGVRDLLFRWPPRATEKEGRLACVRLSSRTRSRPLRTGVRDLLFRVSCGTGLTFAGVYVAGQQAISLIAKRSLGVRWLATAFEPPNPLRKSSLAEARFGRGPAIVILSPTGEGSLLLFFRACRKIGRDDNESLQLPLPQIAVRFRWLIAPRL